MKKLLLILSVGILLTSCTDNQRARSFGGRETIELEANRKLINISWKQDDLWILTEQVDSIIPKVYKLQEKSSFGLMEGTIVIKESKVITIVKNDEKPSDKFLISKFSIDKTK